MVSLNPDEEKDTEYQMQTNELAAMASQMFDEEKKILQDLDNSSVYILRPAIKNYILNNVQLYREGIKL